MSVRILSGSKVKAIVHLVSVKVLHWLLRKKRHKCAGFYGDDHWPTVGSVDHTYDDTALMFLTRVGQIARLEA